MRGSTESAHYRTDITNGFIDMNKPHFTTESGLIRLLVETLLKSPYDLKWSVQGLGMIRTYLSDAVRLHIWISDFKIPGVSPIHDHPWHLYSNVIAGVYRQRRYKIMETDLLGQKIIDMPFAKSEHELNPTFQAGVRAGLIEKFRTATIKCGEGAFKTEDVNSVWVERGLEEEYRVGSSYMQSKDEIHESFPLDGTVTIVTRTFTPDREHARIFWRGDGDWVDAAPRPASLSEIKLATQKSLSWWAN